MHIHKCVTEVSHESEDEDEGWRDESATQQIDENSIDGKGKADTRFITPGPACSGASQVAVTSLPVTDRGNRS